MKFTITLNGVKVQKEIPNAWHLVTYRQFVDLMEAGSDLHKRISVFTGIDTETIKKAQIKNFEVLMSCLSFMNKPLNEALPNYILGYKLIKNLEDAAVSRYADIQEEASKFIDVTKEDTSDEVTHKRTENFKRYPAIVARYLCPAPYDYKTADYIAERLWDAPCVEVVAAGNFILARLLASKSGILKTSHLTEATPLNKFKRAMISWLNRLDFSIRYATWRNALNLNVKKYLTGR